MWLVEAEGLRLLFDPLLEPTHHAGVFEVRPRRTVRAEALRPDFVLVSHRHGDHFDVPSLRTLAALDPESVVLTPDELVASAARALGFRTVHVIPPGQKVTLDRVRIVTTPSIAELEWGAVVETDRAVAWNQVDTVPRDAAQLRAWIDEALASLGRKDQRLDLALVAWQPLLEVAAVTGGATTFPLRRYRTILDQIAALSPRAIVPSACGSRHRAHAEWLDRHVYPVSEARFRADLARYAPAITTHASSVGARYRVENGEVQVDPEGSASLVDVHETDVPHLFDPSEIPALTDPDQGTAPLAHMSSSVDRWVHERLASALANAHPTTSPTDPLVFSLEVVWPATRDEYTFRVFPSGTRVEREHDPEWHCRNRVAGSLLFEVIEGRYHWGDVLLGGCLRAITRSYTSRAGAVEPMRLAPVFLYYALPYDESARRAVTHAVSRARE